MQMCCLQRASKYMKLEHSCKLSRVNCCRWRSNVRVAPHPPLSSHGCLPPSSVFSFWPLSGVHGDVASLRAGDCHGHDASPQLLSYKAGPDTNPASQSFYFSFCRHRLFLSITD